MAIPKKIHYCWFGKKPLTSSALKCIESWSKYCPDYEIIEWNENNIEIKNKYASEALKSQKWAFVSDYIRLYVLKKHGGIYLDTDVELLKNLDELLNNKAFIGFESNMFLGTAVIGAEANHPWIDTLLDYYKNKSFILNNGAIDTTTNVVYVTNLTKSKYNINLDGSLQQTQNKEITIYPYDFLSPKNYVTGKINKTPNTYTIHHFDGSWYSNTQKFKMLILRLSGPKISTIILNTKKKLRLLKSLRKGR